MAIKAFIDHGYTDPHTFCIRLLQSPDFLNTTISKFSTSGENKDSKAVSVADGVVDGVIDKNMLLLAYCEQPRQWFSYKTGNYVSLPKLKNPSKLLTEFGKPGWYGPINDKSNNCSYYIKPFRRPYYISDGDGKIEKKGIRWSLISKVTKTHIVCYWNGFTSNQEDRLDSHSQFPFWHYVPAAFKALEYELGGSYKYEELHRLILKDVWNMYISAPDHIWKHLAVRAEASGVNLNARSKGVSDINVKGLLALASKLSKQLINDIYPDPNMRRDKTLLKKAESSVLRTLIHEWGTKSYEFSLDKVEKKLFKSHCYFGLKSQSETQDCFPHFKCFNDYGGAKRTFEFLISHS